MNTGWENREELLRFGLELRGIENRFENWAEEVSTVLRHIVLDRVDRGEFLGGAWQNLDYSGNSIKAHKLGWVNVQDNEMNIGGIAIDRDDWYWGGYSKDGNFAWSNGRKIPKPQWEPIPDAQRGRNTPRPAPVFIPGYRGWRIKYLGLTNRYPNLELSGMMKDNFDVFIQRGVGSNQYQTRVEVALEVEQSFKDVAQITDYFRQWIDITEDELNEAIAEVGSFFVDR